MTTKTATKQKAEETQKATAELVEFKSNRGAVYKVRKKDSHLTSVSQVIRSMAADGIDKGDIAKTTGILYQHVRNVLAQPVKKAS